MTSPYDYDIVNLGESHTISTNDMIGLIESALGMVANRVMMPSQPGDVERTFADISYAKSRFGYQPKTSIYDGVAMFVDWYRAPLPKT